jgi:hypothetical protein
VDECAQCAIAAEHEDRSCPEHDTPACRPLPTLTAEEAAYQLEVLEVRGQMIEIEIEHGGEP